MQESLGSLTENCASDLINHRMVAQVATGKDRSSWRLSGKGVPVGTPRGIYSSRSLWVSLTKSVFNYFYTGYALGKLIYHNLMILDEYPESCRDHNLFYLIILNKNLIEAYE